MSISDLKLFVEREIPTFVDLREMGAGAAYHYTFYAPQIFDLGRLLGAPISPGLCATQRNAVSLPATDPAGVVFAYPDKERAAFEMPRTEGVELLELEFEMALSAIQEKDSAIYLRMNMPVVPNLLILANNITRFRRIGESWFHNQNTLNG